MLALSKLFCLGWPFPLSVVALAILWLISILFLPICLSGFVVVMTMVSLIHWTKLDSRGGVLVACTTSAVIGAHKWNNRFYMVGMQVTPVRTVLAILDWLACPVVFYGLGDDAVHSTTVGIRLTQLDHLSIVNGNPEEEAFNVPTVDKLRSRWLVSWSCS